MSQYSLAEHIAQLAATSTDPNDEIYAYLSATDVVRLKRWQRRLDMLRSFKPKGNSAKAAARRGKQAMLVGKVFEKLVRVLLDGCRAIQHKGNVRTTTSEIDFLIGIEPMGLAVPLLRTNGTHLLGEAKCLTTPMKVEWIDEFSGLLPRHSATLGIIFTACAAKKVRSEHRVAFAMHALKGIRIVPFGQTQVSEVVAGKNFLRLLSDQQIKAATHSSDLTL